MALSFYYLFILYILNNFCKLLIRYSKLLNKFQSTMSLMHMFRLILIQYRHDHLENEYHTFLKSILLYLEFFLLFSSHFIPNDQLSTKKLA